MNVLRIIAAVVAVQVAPFASFAQSLLNYSDWRELEQSNKIFYVIGIYDKIEFVGDGNDEVAFALGVGHCVKEIQLNPSMLVQAIDNYYEDDTSTWDSPPIIALHQSIFRGPCLRFINEERAKRGLSLWTALEK